MLGNGSTVLFRFWSSTSAGGLESGKLRRGDEPHYLSEAELSQEFNQHRILSSHTPTAFVSTTSNFLRALHGAYRRIFTGEDAREIKIAFLTAEPNSQAGIWPARELAIKTGTSEHEAANLEHEYLFLWKIPDDNVTHVVSMDLVLRRGFSLGPEIGVGGAFPFLAGMRKTIASQTADLTPFEWGYLCGSAACTFGVRAPVYKLASEMSRCVRSGTYCREDWAVVVDTINEVIQDRVVDVAEDLENSGEVEFLMFELSCLEDTHEENIMEIGWELQNCQYAESSPDVFAREETEIAEHRLRIADLIENVYQSAGL